MNWKTFFAMLRDVHVARRNFVVLLLQTFLQPLMFVFIFGRVMVRGYMPRRTRACCFRRHGDRSVPGSGPWPCR